MRAPIKKDAEFEAVLAHTASMERPAMYRLMMLLSIRLGLRPMELAGLETSWFRSDELRIPLGHSKRKSGRSLPISEEIIDALEAHMGSATGRVFRNARGEAFDAAGISMAMRRLYKRAGVEGCCYSGRRTLATSMVDKDINIAVVSKVLGHSSIATTQSYIGVSDNMMRRALFA
ncbi:tyrosine-type recombinase/integrase [Sphingomonas sp. Ag1]|jgi:integrase/recombinase XerD|uniref:tyrosine-type recombinase/integrase n=1 Tax=Sphingomonas sp. Ag1 TaxID=1642949 RepID=UPI000695E1CF|nr:tyrosine-type recombinase/integrase [Sphingomonas sp. Ag1]